LELLDGFEGSGQGDDGPVAQRGVVGWTSDIVAGDLPLLYVSAIPATNRAASPVAVAPVARPALLAGDDTAFAFYNPDEALSPWLKPRSLMFATKARDPVAGDLVMVTDRQGRTRVRLLLSINEDGLQLSKSMPAVVDEIFRFEDIEDIATVVSVQLA
jgi:hypothetical protein